MYNVASVFGVKFVLQNGWGKRSFYDGTFLVL